VHKLFSNQALAAFKKFCEVDAATAHLRPQGAADGITNQLRTALNKAGISPRQLGGALKRVGRAYDEMVGAPDPGVVNMILEALGESIPDAGIVKIMKALHGKWPGVCGEMFEEGEHVDDDFVGEDEADEDAPAANPNPNRNYRGQGSEAFDDPGPTPGTPRPGGGHWPFEKRGMAGDAAMRFTNAEADYFKMFPAARRLGLDPIMPMTERSAAARPSRSSSSRMAMDAAPSGDANSYERMFGAGSSRSRVL
jgi:hypothetical protein